MDLAEAEDIKKRWQEYTGELNKEVARIHRRTEQKRASQPR